MEVINNKISYLLKNGLLHVFRSASDNYLYFREYNMTFKVTDNIFLDIKINRNINGLELIEINTLINKVKLSKCYKYFFLSIYNWGGEENIQYLIDQLPTFSIDNIQTEIILDNNLNLNEIEQISYACSQYDINEILIVFYGGIKSLTGLALGLNDTIKFIETLDPQNEMREINCSPDKTVIKIMYHEDYETHILALIEKYDTIFILEFSKNANCDKFFKFLKAYILESDTDKVASRLYNVSSIRKYLLAQFVNIREIQYTDQDGLKKEVNSICGNCWAHNICWFLKQFEWFGIDLKNLSPVETKCNSIRNLIEETISSLYKLKRIETVENFLTVNRKT